MSSCAIETENLTKIFGSKLVAVNNVSMKVDRFSSEMRCNYRVENSFNMGKAKGIMKIFLHSRENLP